MLVSIVGVTQCTAVARARVESHQHRGTPKQRSGSLSPVVDAPHLPTQATGSTSLSGLASLLRLPEQLTISVRECCLCRCSTRA